MTRRRQPIDKLNQAFDRLQDLLPDRPAQLLGWLHEPESRHVRMPLGILLVILSFFSFLPVIGIEFLPMGLLLIAQDIPVLRQPVGKTVLPMINWTDRQLKKWKKWRAA